MTPRLDSKKERSRAVGLMPWPSVSPKESFVRQSPASGSRFPKTRCSSGRRRRRTASSQPAALGRPRTDAGCSSRDAPQRGRNDRHLFPSILNSDAPCGSGPRPADVRPFGVTPLRPAREAHLAGAGLTVTVRAIARGWILAPSHLYGELRNLIRNARATNVGISTGGAANRDRLR